MSSAFKGYAYVRQKFVFVNLNFPPLVWNECNQCWWHFFDQSYFVMESQKGFGSVKVTKKTEVAMNKSMAEYF